MFGSVFCVVAAVAVAVVIIIVVAAAVVVAVVPAAFPRALAVAAAIAAPACRRRRRRCACRGAADGPRDRHGWTQHAQLYSMVWPIGSDTEDNANLGNLAFLRVRFFTFRRGGEHGEHPSRPTGAILQQFWKYACYYY